MAEQRALGSVLSKVCGPFNKTVPPFVELIPKTQYPLYSRPASPGFLGLAHESAHPSGDAMTDMTLQGISLARLADRRRLLGTLDRSRRTADASGILQQLAGITSLAFASLTSSKRV